MRSPFPYKGKIRHITDCMHVASEEGEYVYKKNSLAMSYESDDENHGNSVQMVPLTDPTVCGFYVVAEPYKTVEIIFNHLDASCESGALLGFVDGWELNGEYFPSVHDHRLPLAERVTEFCVEDHQRRFPYRRSFRAGQNAALLQYRIPKHGSFMISVKFHSNPDPCHIMATDNVPVYVLKASATKSRNCTLTALYPATVSLLGLHIGRGKGANYDCEAAANKLTVGGSSGLDSYGMEAASHICGNSDEVGPKQAIFCGVTTVRLSSMATGATGGSDNNALIALRKADEEDLDLATLVCQLL